MDTISYGFGVDLENTDLEQAVTRVSAALAEVGFGILTRIDVHRTLKEKLGADFRPYAILGACHPQLALKALQAEGQVGLLMPCNVVVQENPSSVTVSAIDPEKLVDFVGEGETAGVMREAASLLNQAFSSL